MPHSKQHIFWQSNFLKAAKPVRIGRLQRDLHFHMSRGIVKSHAHAPNPGAVIYVSSWE